MNLVLLRLEVLDDVGVEVHELDVVPVDEAVHDAGQLVPQPLVVELPGVVPQALEVAGGLGGAGGEVGVHGHDGEGVRATEDQVVQIRGGRGSDPTHEITGWVGLGHDPTQPKS